MKFSVAAVIAAAAGASAAAAGNVTYVTEVVDVYTTYCPAATEITQGGKTYTVTKPTTLTITDCPCTITKPVITTSAVVCKDCAKPSIKGNNSTFIPVVPTGSSGAKSTPAASTPTGKGSSPSKVPTAGAGKVAALSGAGLAAIVGLAAFL